MLPERLALSRVVESVADGAADVDWDGLEARADVEDRKLIRQLRILASISEVHRSLPDEPEAVGGINAVAQSAAARPDASNASASIARVIGRIVPTEAAGAPPPHPGGPNTPEPPPPSGPHKKPIDRAPSAQRAAVTQAVAAASPSGPTTRYWGHLELLERVGEGSFGEVFRARDTHLEREVALKLLHVGRPEDNLGERVLHEARVLARLHHPNVVGVHGAEEHDDRVGLWMEFIRGRTLAQLLRVQGAFGAREAVLIGQDLCRALAAVHGAGLVHRDVKAQNVMREEGGRVVLMDFGAGRLRDGGASVSGPLTGTPLYLAPEVLAGGDATVRSDIYSLGVLLYHLVTNDFPLRGRTLDELRQAHRANQRTRLHDARPDLPDAFVDTVERAIDPDPAKRFESVGQMQGALATALGFGSADASAIPRAGSAPAARSQSAWLPYAMAAAVVACVAGSVFLAQRWGGGGDLPPARLAVLPLADLGGAHTNLAAEVTEGLITSLGQMSALRVTSRTSIMGYTGTTKPLPQIARELGVGAIVEGAIKPEGDRLRVRVRVIRAGTDSQLWATTLDTPMTEALELGGLAMQIAQKLGVDVSAGERSRFTTFHVPQAAAQAAYLEGRFELAKENREGLERARVLLERAVARDPEYAKALSSLAHCYILLEEHGILPREEAHDLARSAAERATTIDPESSDAHLWLAQVRFQYDWDWPAAAEAFERAIAVNPSGAAARTWYARYLAARGRVQEARTQAEQALELDPLSPTSVGTVALMRYYQRDFVGALPFYERAAEMAPQVAMRHLGIGRVQAELRHHDASARALARAVELSNGAPAMKAELARTLALGGRRDGALALLRELEELDNSGKLEVNDRHLAYIHAALGDPENALHLLEGAVSSREPGVLWLKVDPRVDPLRGDPRFATLLQKLGLR